MANGERSLEANVGNAVKRDRLLKELTLAQLSNASGVSTAMISKIERGQVSASLNILDALAVAIGVPVVNFLADTVGQTDISHVRAGEGVSTVREGETFSHSFRTIGQARADSLQLRVHRIELNQTTLGEPLLSHPGVEFIHVLEGSMTYRCGQSSFELKVGDSLTFETRVPHGPEVIHGSKVVILTAIAEPVPV